MLCWYTAADFGTLSVHDFIRLIPNACFRLQAREQQISDLDTEVSQLQQQVREHEENALKRDKAIQGLVAALVQKDEQVLPVISTSWALIQLCCD